MIVLNCIRYLLWALYVCLTLHSVDAAVSRELNNRPVIGIVAQEIEVGNNSRSYISAGYVKAIEASGAQVVPIFINRTLPYYRRLVTQLNGVVIPGGGAVYGVQGGFSEAVSNVLNIAKELNDVGIKFPILGVCQGMEVLAYLEGHPKDSVLIPCNASNMNLPLNFTSDAKYSQLYSFLPASYRQTLVTQPITTNHHELCLTRKNMDRSGVSNNWLTLSTNFDMNGLEFVSSVEHRRYPFAGVQFHPEKPAYEWNNEQHNPHNYQAIYVNRYFYDWLVNMARLNWNHLSNTTLPKLLIYNFPVTYAPHEYDLEYYFFQSTPVREPDDLNL